MSSYYITHFLNEQLPAGNKRKQISFLTATPESYQLGVFYYGYSGRRRLTEVQLSEELAEKRIIKLRNPIVVSKKKYLWIDSLAELWLSDDALGMVGMQPASEKEAGKPGMQKIMTVSALTGVKIKQLPGKVSQRKSKIEGIPQEQPKTGASSRG
jgi:hypothetical protein